GDEWTLPNEAAVHLAGCDSCRRRVSMETEAHRVLRMLGQQVSAKSSPDCPSEGAIQELAAHLTEGAASERLLEHASACDHCGPILRRAIELFHEVRSDEEESLIASLGTSQEAGRQVIARRLANLSKADGLKAPVDRPAAQPLRASVPLWGWKFA